jgi:adenylate cyclase
VTPRAYGVGSMRLHRTFAFVDLSGFTAYTHEHGDEAGSAVLSEFRAQVRAVATEHGVRVAKWLGDGAMLVGVDSSTLVAAAVDLNDRMRTLRLALPLRTGLASGAVLVFEGDDYLGTTVNLASRLCDLAAPGEVLATSELATVAPATTRAETYGICELPGISEPIAVVRLLSTHAASGT